MIRSVFIIVFSLLVTTFVSAQTNIISLAGAWQVRLDSTNETVAAHPARCKTNGTINLPGSLAENGFGMKTTGSDFGVLTPGFKYVGKAWYKKQIEIPKSWAGKTVELLLERVLWESRVFIDGKELSVQDALGTPHIHQLEKVAPGVHELTIRVDNEMIHNIGDKGHAYGEYTQSIWNGIVGKIELRAKDAARVLACNVYSNIQDETIALKTVIGADKSGDAKISYKVVSIKTGKTVLAGNFAKKIKAGETKLDLLVPTNGELKKWSEFAPEVYRLEMQLEAGKNHDNFETEFGFVQISHNGTKILVNGTPVFLRGNIDCVHFPETGYPSCNVDDWIKIFKTYKDYGLNHVRFHSWCPPEAAFKAASRIGIYMQAEASIWIDWWMSEDMIEKGRPEMDTKGHPKGLGYDAGRDKFVVAEMDRVVDTYGNYPSFTMFCIGNELGNSDFGVMKKWVAALKEKDPRRLYAISTARTITDVDDYSVTHYIKDVGRTRGLNGPRTNWDFEKTYAQMNIPIIAHEIGQWPVYPRWSEIEKYRGVLKARNFEGFKVQAEKNGIVGQNNEFADASGALNQIMYKYETESFLRTESCAGVQLLSMQDYQGQGEALIGWLDCHWESKGITTPEKFRQHYNSTVPLLLTEKFVWENDEVFTAGIKISHHAENDLSSVVVWKISDEQGNNIDSGKFPKTIFPNGTLTNLGEIKTTLAKINSATKLTISVSVSGTPFKNEWDIWTYPKSLPKLNNNEIVITEKLDDEMLKELNSGAKVLLNASELGTVTTSVKALFYPLYWSLTFFPGQGKTNIGLLLNEDHAAFNNFPTSFHSNWQWETISADAKGFILNDLPHNFRPIAQPIDDFHRNNKVGSIFELKVGEGKLLVCGYNLNADRPVARQLKSSLLEYMDSEDFDPTLKIDENWLRQTFENIPKAKIANIPEEFKDAILIVNAAKNLQVENKSTPWKQELDKVDVAKKSIVPANV